MNIDLFLSTLPYMLKGMLGIFSITLIMILSIVVLNKVSAPKGQSKSGKQSGASKADKRS